MGLEIIIAVSLLVAFVVWAWKELGPSITAWRAKRAKRIAARSLDQVVDEVVAARRALVGRSVIVAPLAFLLAYWVRAPGSKNVLSAATGMLSFFEFFLHLLGVSLAFVNVIVKFMNVGYAVVFGPVLIVAFSFPPFFAAYRLRVAVESLEDRLGHTVPVDGLASDPRRGAARADARVRRFVVAFLLVATMVAQYVVSMRYVDLRCYVPPATVSARLWDYPFPGAEDRLSWLGAFRHVGFSGCIAALPDSTLERFEGWVPNGAVWKTPYDDFPEMFPGWGPWLNALLLVTTLLLCLSSIRTLRYSYRTGENPGAGAPL